MKRFEDYKDAVIKAYQKKKNEGSLPFNLDRHTAANLKNECVDEFPTRYSDKDSETFKLLFGKVGDAKEYYHKIKASDPDIFRPLNTFLKGNINKTKDRNIHLLAWLIDFEQRPFKPVDPYLLGNIDNTLSKDIAGSTLPTSDDSDTDSIHQEPEDDQRLINDTDTIISSPPQIDDTDDETGSKIWRDLRKLLNKRKTVMIGLVSIPILLTMYIVLKPRYMYWNGNEYKPIAFYQKIEPPVVVVPIDSLRPSELKKITNLKSITRSSIGKVHYSKLDHIIKFYTLGGENPEDTTRRLLPMTEYIYKKYVLGKIHQN